MTRPDLALMFASLLHGIDRARRVGDEPRVRDLRWHLAALWAHVGEHLAAVVAGLTDAQRAALAAVRADREMGDV